MNQNNNFYELLNNSLGQTFSLNTNIIETNLINLVIVLGVVIYFGSQFLDSLLSARKNSILQSLEEIETRFKQTNELFEKVCQDRDRTKQKAKEINEQALNTIEQVKTQLNQQYNRDILKLEQTKQLTIEFEKEKVLTQIRQQISQLAFKKANQKLQTQLINPESQRKLIDKKIRILNTLR
uniref:ATP synthase subunit b, chloroplastic n=1 Tax=Palmophyllum crassum TaxID=1615899 RepID=A0A1L7NY23_9VIRI|nr:ATP synthase CF0 B subunit [Palmophyllum crassum]BAW34815.1 ATP synthase CF0 B subunit [Palmophyllum crassum]